jgi:hypothetical protein
MNSMATEKSGFAQPIFWGICAVLLTWATITICLEVQAGWPVDRAAWGHRLIAWFINFVLVRTFLTGMRRYYAAKAK